MRSAGAGVDESRVHEEGAEVKTLTLAKELRLPADEAPQCYKRLPDVLAAHGPTIRILHTLRPIGVAMAGKDMFDPFKD